MLFDVSGIGGTLTLTSGQFLKGNGTLTGVLAAPAGSIVAARIPDGNAHRFRQCHGQWYLPAKPEPR